MSVLLTGADTIRDDLGLLPSGLDVYASYVDNYGGYPELLGMRGKLNPHATYLSYTIFGNRAHIADVEPGAMHPESAARWLRAGKGIPLPGARVPGIYTSAGSADELFAALGLVGWPHDRLPPGFIYQSAHYGHGPHICGPATCGYRQAHGTQWTDTGPNGENYDRALWLPGLFGGSELPPLPEGTVSIATTSENGRLDVFVHLESGEVKHTWRTADSHVHGPGRWHGQDEKNPEAPVQWTNLGNPGK